MAHITFEKSLTYICLICFEHWGNDKSLRRIERENGFSNDCLRKFASNRGIPIRNRRDSIIADSKYVVKPSGEKHWSKLNPEAHKQACEVSSERMKANNPVYIEGVREQMSRSCAKTFRKNPTRHEKIFADFLDENRILYSFQSVVGGKYIADFRFGQVLLELDGRGHAGRTGVDSVRDKFLNKLGFFVVRVDQDSLCNLRKSGVFRPIKLCSVLEKYIPYFDISRFDPSLEHGKYRVIVREAYSCAEIIY